MPNTIYDPMLLLAAGFTNGASSQGALTDQIVAFDDMVPDHLLQPITHRNAAALLGITAAQLSLRRTKGLAPPGYTRTALGRYYPSRHVVIRWLASQGIPPKGDLRSFIVAYPFLELTRGEMIDRAIERHPAHFETEMGAVEASDFLNRSTCAIHSALYQQRGTFAQICRKDGRVWRYGTRAELLEWLTDELFIPHTNAGIAAE